MDNRALLGTYFRQQAELGMPDGLVLDPVVANILSGPSISRAATLPTLTPATPSPLKVERAQTSSPPLRPALPKAPAAATDFKSRLSSLRPVEQLMASAPKTPARVVAPPAPTINTRPAAQSSNRTALRELYLAGCTACRLAGTRTKLVFGAGNADAKVMVIGSAPGPLENEQGIPFVGEAGHLLTNMLAAIKLDRATDVFITNVIKCFIPDGHDPDHADIAACLPLLIRQIGIIQPKAILILGQPAAAALLSVTDAIGVLRTRTFDYGGVPAMVTHDPAALLRNSADKRAAWEDLQRFSTLLSSLGVYGSIDKK